MRKKRSCKNPLLIFAVMIFVVATSYGSADALGWSDGNTSLDVDILMKYTMAARAEKQDPELLARLGATSDDGERNFERWDLTTNKINIITDIEFNHDNKFGFFVRPKFFWDNVYKTNNSNDSPLTNSAFLAGKITNPQEWSDDMEDIYGSDAHILDAFIWTTFNLGERYVDIRLGSQTIAWGEAFFLGGGISTASIRMDLAVALSAGVELKEMYLPTEALYIQMDLSDSVALKTFYQYKWRGNKYFEAGAFGAPTDLFDEAAYGIVVAPGVMFPRLADQEARDDGQWGLGMTYVANWLDEWEFGLFYGNYHSKGAVVNVTIPFGYNMVYPEDIQMYGLSVSGCLGTTQLSAEISTHKDTPISAAVRYDLSQVQISWFAMGTGCGPGLLQDLKWADNWLSIGEVGYAWESGRMDGVTAGVDNGNSTASGIVCFMKWNWIQTFQNTDTNFTVGYGDTIHSDNITRTVGAGGWMIGNTSGYVTFGGTYKTNLMFALKYSAIFGTMAANGDRDRDQISLELSYGF